MPGSSAHTLGVQQALCEPLLGHRAPDALRALDAGHAGSAGDPSTIDGAARRSCAQAGLTRRLRERIHSSKTTTLMEKPIQNAIPKNWFGVRCVRGLVAKKIPTTGRVVAIPRRMAIDRSSHVRSCCGAAWLR